MDLKFKQDENFEECIVQALLSDHVFAEQMVEVLNVEYFNLEYLKELTKIIFNYFGKYRTFPSPKLLGTIIKNEIPDSDKALKDQIKNFWMKMMKQPLNGDMEYIKETTLDYCRKRSLALALEASLSLIEEKRYDEISHEIKKALQAGSERTIGHDYMDHFEVRMKKEAYNPIPTPWAELNKRIKGGLGSGKLGVVCAPTGVGKSHALVDIGSCALLGGFNVAHYTLEDPDVDVANRYDSRLTGIAVDNLIENKDFVKKKLDEVLAGKGRLIIKSYPTRSASLLTIKNHYQTLLMRGMKPDIIIVDYADLLKGGTADSDSRRFNEEAIYEELRGWAMELKIPIWTATQVNRSGLDVEVITLKYIAECFAKAMISHLFITINRQKDGPNPEIGNMFIAKNKIGADGVKLPMMINTAISKIEVLPPDSDFSAAANDDDRQEQEVSRLRRVFKEYQKKLSTNVGLSSD